MSTFEITPQKEKPYKEYSQDHGDAASQKNRDLNKSYRDDDYVREVINRNDQANLAKDLNEIYDIDKPMSRSELEAAADRILDAEDNEESRETLVWTSDSVSDAPDDEDNFDVSEQDRDVFATEADLGLLTRHEIRLAMAQRATQDYLYNQDDTLGDQAFNSGLHFTNRP